MDNRQAEERRFAAVQTLRAVVECLRDTNPQAIFVSGKEAMVETMKMQSITNRWADKAADVLMGALDLAELIGQDGLALFRHPEQGE